MMEGRVHRKIEFVQSEIVIASVEVLCETPCSLWFKVFAGASTKLHARIKSLNHRGHRVSQRQCHRDQADLFHS